MCDYYPRRKTTLVPRETFGETGKRTHIDDIQKLVAIKRLRTVDASGRAFLAGATGDVNLDSALTRSTSSIFLGKLSAFHGCTRLSLVWDPGTYTGKHWSCGYAFSLDIDLATTLPIKA